MAMAWERSDKQMLMEAMLNDHYEKEQVSKKRKSDEAGLTESGKTLESNLPCPSGKCDEDSLSHENVKKIKSVQNVTLAYRDVNQAYRDEFFVCDLCPYTSIDIHSLKIHIQKHITGDAKQWEYDLYIPSVKPAICGLLASKSNSERKIYYQIEVIRRVSRTFLPSSQLDKLFPSEQLLFFIPARIFEGIPDIRAWDDITVSCEHIKDRIYRAKFPGFNRIMETVLWAEHVAKAMSYIMKKKIVMFSKNRFDIIQNFNNQVSAIPFCEYIDQPNNKPVKNFRPEMNFDGGSEMYKCPMLHCEFESHKKFTGIRIHLTQHFKDKIKKNAKPKTDIQHICEEIPSCLTKWTCSIPALESSGELVQHYGILHCLVDTFFKEYVTTTIWGKCGQYRKTCCFCEDVNFETVDDLIAHLTLEHFFEDILKEVEDKVFFKKINQWTVEYKCPLCNIKFQNGTDSDLGDTKDLVKHCGSVHGFTFYHLMMSQLDSGGGGLEEIPVEVGLEEIPESVKDKLKEEPTDYSIKIEEEEEEANEESYQSMVINEFGVEIFIPVEEVKDEVTVVKGEVKEEVIDVEEESNAVEETVKEEVTDYSIKFETINDEIKMLDYSTELSIYSCPVCSNKYKHKEGLRRHMKTQHGPDSNLGIDLGLVFSCPVCPNKYRHKESVSRHLKNQHGPTNQTYKCEFCDYADDAYSRLKYHMRTQHKNRKLTDFTKAHSMLQVTDETGTKYWKCQHCEKQASTREALKKHIQRYHKHQVFLN